MRNFHIRKVKRILTSGHLPLRVITHKGTLNAAKVLYWLRFASGINSPLGWKYGMEYGRKFQCRVEYEMEDFIEWKKITSMDKGKIVFHSIPCPASLYFL